MSLASRVSNLFSGFLVPEREQNKLGFGDDGLSDEGLIFADSRSSIHAGDSDTMAPKNVEEEGRPPYLHVRATLGSQYANMANICRL